MHVRCNKVNRIAAGLAVGLGLTLTAAFAPTLAADYPLRPLRFVVPYPPGGSTDALARILSERLSRRLQQPVVVDNRAGNGGNVGSEWALKQPPDGYTILMVTAAMGAAPALVANLPYDPVRDVQPIAKLADLPMLMVATRELPISNLQELYAYGRANPGALNYVSYGVGSTMNIQAIKMNARAGVKAEMISFKGAGQAMPELIAGRVHFVIDGIASSAPLVQAGKLTPLAVLSTRRHPLLPQVPTVGEAGMPGYEYNSWFGVGGPRGMPREVLDRLVRDVALAAQEPEVGNAIRDQFMVRDVQGPDAFGDLIRREVANWTDSARAAGIKAE